MTASWATKRCISAPIWLKPAGPRLIPFWMCGRRYRRATSPTMPQDHGDQKKPRKSSGATVAPGDIFNRSSDLCFMPDKRIIRIAPDAATLCRAAVDEFRRCAKESIRERGRFCVALSGGSTPRGVYALLADDQKNSSMRLPWDKVFIFFGDERHVPPDHPQSNYPIPTTA